MTRSCTARSSRPSRRRSAPPACTPDPTLEPNKRMGLLDRLTGGTATAEPPPQASLDADARSMRSALDAFRREVGSSRATVRDVLREMLTGEIAAPTADVAKLRARGTDPDAFYTREIAASWDGLNEAQRAARLEGFLEMLALLASAGDAAGLPEDM